MGCGAEAEASTEDQNANNCVDLVESKMKVKGNTLESFIDKFSEAM